MVKNKGKISFFDIPGSIAIVSLLIILAAAWPAVLLHGNARWVGEGLWVGIPGLLVTSFIVTAWWKSRDERQLKKLRDERLWAEGNHPTQLRLRYELEQEKQELRAAEQARKAKAEAAERRKQQLRDEIRREKQLRDERLRRSGG